MQVVQTSAFELLVADYQKKHRDLSEDLEWLEGRLKIAPDKLGNLVPQLQNLALPIYKTRCKDSCCNIGASGGWRVYYAVNSHKNEVLLLFLHHKREYEMPQINDLIEKLENAFDQSEP